MNKEELIGGKADGMSISDIAKLHGVSVDKIKKEIEAGLPVESEHTTSKEEQLEVVKDHLVEDPRYYTDPKTGLIAKEKESEERMKKEKMNEEVKKMMALSGIKEGNKKFLRLETFLNDAEKKKDSSQEQKSDTDSEFTVIKFDQKKFNVGEDDEKLYKLK